jgi:arylsulfatase A
MCNNASFRNRWATIAFVIAAVLPLCAVTSASAAPKPRPAPSNGPNIVFILIDDLGWSELGCQGNRFNETPNIDKLAAGGLRFTQAYAAAPVCSPTRAALMTGQYPARVGITDFLRANDRKFLPTGYYTLPYALRDVGFTTGLIGKWHLMGDYTERKGDPGLHGFDQVICSESRYIADGDYFAPYKFMPAVRPLEKDEYLTDRLDEEAIAFISRHKDKPFFLDLSHYAVHTVLAGKPDLVARFRAKPGAGKPGCNPEMAAMLFSVDEGVGRIVSTLEQLGLTDRTLIVVTSDNGGECKVTTNAPLRAGKSTLYEGGIRVPLIVSGAGVKRTGVCETPVCTIDWYPTFAELAGVQPKRGYALDGESICPLLRGDGKLRRDTLYWHFALDEPLKRRPASAIRHDSLKLIQFLDNGQRQLFDLDKDIGEQHDLAAERPADVKELTRMLDEWRPTVNAKGPSTRAE